VVLPPEIAAEAEVPPAASAASVGAFAGAQPFPAQVGVSNQERLGNLYDTLRLRVCPFKL